ncbi:MAG: homoserine dehydrogenase [Candidatus Dormibacteraeota bacterium]|nr:homoserine dehydrogenase [Candidatus Dormibacteraeota bacterium]
MNYDSLFAELASRRIRLALTGAGGFGRSLLVACRAIPSIQVAGLCDLDLDGTRAMLASLSLPGEVGATAEEVRRAQQAGRTALVRDHALLAALGLDIVVEATGAPETSLRIAQDAIGRGVHVAMVSKETDCIAGPWLNKLARDKGVVYTTPDGDQPSNLIGLVSWARVLGLEVIAAGKASEYDYVFNSADGTLRYMDRTLHAPGLAALWPLGDSVPARMTERAELLSALPQSATPDYCEMNVVANSTGLQPSQDRLSYPLCRTAELADVFIPAGDGGILQRTGVVDVFNCLRRDDEASFAGGVFVVVRCTDAEVWRMLAEKGHLVSRDGRYACIYLPYHLMGIETPISLFSAVLHGRPSGSATQSVQAVMAARAERDFSAGEMLSMGGHHHAIGGMRAELLPREAAEQRVAPFYVVANKRLTRDVARGTLVTLDVLDLAGSGLAQAWRESLKV